MKKNFMGLQLKPHRVSVVNDSLKDLSPAEIPEWVEEMIYNGTK